jgi:hypothetical protein
MSEKVTIEIETGNAAFDEGDSGYEVARILRKLANEFENYDPATLGGRILFDYNGNKVGGVKVTGKRK